MGYMRHHAVCVTDHGHGDFIETAYAKASELFSHVTLIVVSPVNHIRSFFVAPDGSKEEWPESDEGNRQRDDFIMFLNSLRYGDGSSPLSWCLVQYGDEHGNDCLLLSDQLEEIE